MAKTKVSEWDSVAANNTDINSININEGCPPSTINNAIRETMAQIKDWQDGSSGDGWTSSGTVTASGTLVSSGTLSVTGNLTLNGAAGTSGQYLTSSGSGTPTWTTLSPTVTFLTGMIILWSGSTGSIPSGWALCNGSSGTPDLRNRFVVGAGSTYAVDATGGSADATLPSHTHTATSSSENAHSHTYRKPASAGFASSSGGGVGSTTVINGATDGQATSTVAAHNHTITVNSSGTSATNANLPPYYALAYIMKL